MMSFPKKRNANARLTGKVEPEAVLQGECEMYMRIRRIEFEHMPDGIFGFVASSQSLPSWFKAWFMSTFKGRPDIVFTLPIKENYSLSFKVELKNAKGKTHGVQTREVATGRWALCRSLDEFIAVVAAAESLATRMTQ